MWIPAMDGCCEAVTARTQAVNSSSDDVMNVGRHRVTPVRAHPIQRAGNGLAVRGGIVEVDPGEAVHLQVEEAGQLDGHSSSRSRTGPRVAASSNAAESRSR